MITIQLSEQYFRIYTVYTHYWILFSFLQIWVIGSIFYIFKIREFHAQRFTKKSEL